MTKKKNPTPAKVQTNAGVNPMGSPKASTLSQGLKIAGTGGITKQELKTITEASGKSGGQVIQRLDKINQNLKAKDQTGINLNSGAANMLIKESGPAYGGFYGLTQKPTFGTGRIGQALEGMRGTRASGGYQNPQSGYGSVTPGTDRRFMMGGTAIRPGGRETVRGFGKQYSLPEQDKKVIKNPIGGEGYVPNQVNNDQTVQDPVDTRLPEESTPEVNINMDSLGSSLANWASGFKTARSSRQRAGRKAQGLGQQRVSPTGSFRGSVG
jgi:hypothetical protein